MKVYEIQCDVDNFQFLSQDLDEFDLDTRIQRRELFTLGKPISQPVTPPAVYSQYPKLKKGDFWSFAGYNTFAAAPWSVEKVRSYLESAGELISIPYEHEMYYAVNVLTRIDCINISQSKMTGFPRKLAFDATRIPSGIFKVPQLVSIFVSEITGDPEIEFKACVEQNGMTGLVFKEVWRSE